MQFPGDGLDECIALRTRVLLIETLNVMLESGVVKQEVFVLGVGGHDSWEQRRLEGHSALYKHENKNRQTYQEYLFCLDLGKMGKPGSLTGIT